RPPHLHARRDAGDGPRGRLPEPPPDARLSRLQVTRARPGSQPTDRSGPGGGDHVGGGHDGDDRGRPVGGRLGAAGRGAPAARAGATGAGYRRCDMSRLARRIVHRRPRTPRPVRAGAALLLGALALIGFAAPGAGGDPSTGGPPTNLANAPNKSPSSPGVGNPTAKFPTSRQL